jgi:acetyl esterase
VAATLCAELGLPVLSAGYRLGPEYRLPAQTHDGAAAIAYARACLGSSLILAGDSAGALVALWGHNAAPARNRDAVIGALLLYGVFGDPPDADDGNPALIEAGLDARSIAAAYRRIDPEQQIGRVTAFTPSMPGFHLPGRTVVVGAGADPLLPHSLRFAVRHPTICHVQIAEAQPHGFLSAPAPTAAAREAVRQAACVFGLHP